MRIRFGLGVLLWLVVTGMLTLPSFAADGNPDGTKDNSTAKPAPKADDTSKPANGLTEREQWMLERIEQLEKRVAELESKGSGTAQPAARAAVSSPPPASPASASAPATIAASPAPPAGNVTSTTAGTVNPNAGSSSSVNPTQDQNAQANANAAPAAPTVAAPFSDADWTWLNGNARTKDIYWDTKFFTPEIRFDTNYVADFNHPTDHSIGGSSELFRSYEVQLEQLGVGGDFH